MPLTPEQRAREKIDRQLEACGWNIHAALSRWTAIRFAIGIPLTCDRCLL